MGEKPSDWIRKGAMKRARVMAYLIDVSTSRQGGLDTTMVVKGRPRGEAEGKGEDESDGDERPGDG